MTEDYKLENLVVSPFIRNSSAHLLYSFLILQQAMVLDFYKERLIYNFRGIDKSPDFSAILDAVYKKAHAEDSQRHGLVVYFK